MSKNHIPRLTLRRADTSAHPDPEGATERGYYIIDSVSLESSDDALVHWPSDQDLEPELVGRETFIYRVCSAELEGALSEVFHQFTLTAFFPNSMKAAYEQEDDAIDGNKTSTELVHLFNVKLSDLITDLHALLQGVKLDRPFGWFLIGDVPAHLVGNHAVNSVNRGSPEHKYILDNMRLIAKVLIAINRSAGYQAPSVFSHVTVKFWFDQEELTSSWATLSIGSIGTWNLINYLSTEEIGRSVSVEMPLSTLPQSAGIDSQVTLSPIAMRARFLQLYRAKCSELLSLSAFTRCLHMIFTSHSVVSKAFRTLLSDNGEVARKYDLSVSILSRQLQGEADPDGAEEKGGGL